VSVHGTIREVLQRRDQELADSAPEVRFTVSVDAPTSAELEQLAKYSGMSKTRFCALLLMEGVRDAYEAAQEYENSQGRGDEFEEYMKEGIETQEGVKVGRVAARSSETLQEWGDE